jgi:hypothetical protein
MKAGVGAAYVCRDWICFRNKGELRNFRHVGLAKLAAQDLPIIIKEARESFEGQSCSDRRVNSGGSSSPIGICITSTPTEIAFSLPVQKSG